jgi:hypothetical protein
MARNVVERICEWGGDADFRREKRYQSWWSTYLEGDEAGAADAAASTMEVSSTAGVTERDAEAREELLALWTRRLRYMKGNTQDKVSPFDGKLVLGSIWYPNADAIGYAYAQERKQIQSQMRSQQFQWGNLNDMASGIVAHILQWASTAQDDAPESQKPQYTPPYVPWVNGWVTRTRASGSGTTVGSSRMTGYVSASESETTSSQPLTSVLTIASLLSPDDTSTLGSR